MRHSVYFIIFSFILFLLCHACYFPEQTLTEEQKNKVQKHILTTAPTPQIPINAIIRDEIKLIGIDLSKTEVAPGGQVTVTYYLEALKEETSNARIFVHFQGANKQSAWMNLDHHPVEGLWPLRNLKKGEILKDVQTFNIKGNFPNGPTKLYWGLYEGNHRYPVSNPKDLQVDAEGRVLLTTIQVKGKMQLNTATALYQTSEIKLDGKLDEPAWANATWTPNWISPRGEISANTPKTKAKFIWNDQALYIGVEAIDTDVWGNFTERDSNTWEEEVVEVFLDPDGDRRDYLELQFTPQNVIFDARFEYRRSDLAKARAWQMNGLQSAVWVDGTLNDRSDIDRSVSFEILIPFSEVPGASLAITDGQKWRVNLFRFDFPKGSHQLAAAFSPPIVPDFHALEQFGFLIFKKPVSNP